MRVTLLCTPDTSPTCRWLLAELSRRDHVVDVPAEVTSFAAAADAGHALADGWDTAAPDVVLALGWEAGLAAQVAARDTPIPVVLRLPRAGRPTGSDRDRLETALARSSAMVLVPSAGELDRLVDRGVDRRLVRVLPEAVDRSRFPDGHAQPESTSGRRVALVEEPDGASAAELRSMLNRLPGCEPVVVPEDPDDERRAQLLPTVAVALAVSDAGPGTSLVLQAMATGVPVIALDRGVLSDLVADGVTGLLVPRPAALPEALLSLLSDPMRLQSMGLAAVDRVKARFDTTVVGAALERLLLEAVPVRSEAPWRAEATAS